MYNNNSNGSRAARARGFMALCAMLAVGLGLMIRPAEAAPFAYVTNGISGVSVIDTATTPPSVVATIPVLGLDGLCCDYLTGGVAVAPDGKHVFVTGDNVSVIDTATNKVVVRGRLGDHAFGVAVTPDGKYAYVPVPSYPADVVVIATPPNTGGTTSCSRLFSQKGCGAPGRSPSLTPTSRILIILIPTKSL